MRKAMGWWLLLWSACALAKGESVQVTLLMFDGVQVIDFAAPYEVFGQAGFALRTVSRDGKPVRTAMNLKVSVDGDFDSVTATDILVVPGGNTGEVAKDDATLAFVRKWAGTARQVLTVCTGSDILAGTGLLDGKAATTFHKHFDHMQMAYPAVTVVRDQRWVESGKLVTSAGLTSGMDAALHVVANLQGLEAARTVAMHLEYDWSAEPTFVRGTMADQFIRLPEALAFPDGTDFDSQTSFGDRQSWTKEVRVTSPLSPAAFLEHIRQAVEADAALSLLALPDTLQLAWEYEALRGGRWRVDMRGFEADSTGAFRLQLSVRKLG